MIRRQTWTNLLAGTFLEWFETNGILSQKLDTLAKALHWLLEMEVRTNEEAIAVCKAVPAAYKDLKNQMSMKILDSRCIRWLTFT